MKVETISEQLYFTTIHIECENDDGSNSQGTGFVINSHGMDYLVTAKHVVADASIGYLRLHIAENNEPSLAKGKRLKIGNFKNYWISHVDSELDMAVMSMSLVLKDAARTGVKYYYKAIPSQIFASGDKLSELDAFEEIVFLGYPSGIYDKAHYLPVFRRGVTASPIYIDHDAKRRFLVDGAVFAGSSGSPVFLYNKGSYSKRDGVVILGDRVLFLGVLAEGYRDSQEKMPSPMRNEMPSILDGETINLGIVYKADAILEIIVKLNKSG